MKHAVRGSKLETKDQGWDLKKSSMRAAIQYDVAYAAVCCFTVFVVATVVSHFFINIVFVVDPIIVVIINIVAHNLLLFCFVIAFILTVCTDAVFVIVIKIITSLKAVSMGTWMRSFSTEFA